MTNSARAIRRRAEREAAKATRSVQKGATVPVQAETPKLVISTVPEVSAKGFQFNRNVNGRHKRFFNVTNLREGVEKVFAPFLDHEYPLEKVVVSFHMIVEKRPEDNEEINDFLGKITEESDEEAIPESDDTGTDTEGK